MGKTVMVQASQADKNETPSATAASKQQPTRLYVGNLHYNITDEDIQDIFGEFGEVDFVDLHRDPESGVSKGFAFVQFRDPEAAKRALVQVNARELAGSVIKVGLVNNATGKAVGIAGELDEEGGMSLDAQSRANLMAKLQRKDDDEPDVEIPVAPGIQPSNCIVLQNMFDDDETNEPNFENELAEDVKEECAKYGEIKHVRVHKQSKLVYLRFGAVSGAQKAHSELNGRWFGGKMITSEYIAETAYMQLWPHTS